MPSARCLLSMLIPLASMSLCSGQVTLGGYRATSNIREHSKLDLDVRDMGNSLNKFAFASADKVYSNGKNYLKSSGRRTLRGFSTDASAKLKGEGYFDLYRSYWKRADYGDVFVKNALKSLGDFAGKPSIFRAEAAVKGAQYQNVWMYVIHEMEDAINDCGKKNLVDNDNGVAAWDEAWAFYAGSAVGRKGTGEGFLLYTLAQKRCVNFKTCRKGSVAKVNVNILKLFNTGKQQLLKGQCSEVIKTKNAIARQMTVPLVQGVLRYILLTSNATPTGKTKAPGEGWAFTAAVEFRAAQCTQHGGVSSGGGGAALACSACVGRGVETGETREQRARLGCGGRSGRTFQKGSIGGLRGNLRESIHRRGRRGLGFLPARCALQQACSEATPG